MHDLTFFRAQHRCTVKALQSLIGRLRFIALVVKPGRTFLRRMIRLLKGCASRPRRSSSHITINAGFRKDVGKRKAPESNGKTSHHLLVS